ncbi:focadhesin isoform X3 [Cryptotermes secundus]|uniref:focadhesin isoform X3 n=1 Tax=Cryptotermes secundus TaxID=105785 RepID=UPI000CD7C70B|nr:focadhesin isoform X3 [Cryptotermes secundus]
MMSMLPELIFLKERCEDADPVINITACQGVITLVETGVLAVIPTLSGFIAALPTVRNYTGVISSIGALLIIDLKARLSENGSFQCPFNLRSPQHPLISVLKQNKDTWCDVFNIMQFICGHNEEIVAQNSLELLRPVFSYILFDPSLPPNLPMACQQQMWLLLLKTSFSSETKELLFEILCWFQVESETEILSTSHMFLVLVEFALQNEDSPLCTVLAPFTASLIHRLIHHGHDPRSCLSALTHLLAVSPETGSCIMMLLAKTIILCPVIYLKDLVIFCTSLVELKICNAISTKMFVCAVLQWLIYPSCLTGEALQTTTSILTWVNTTTSWSSSTGRIFANRLFNHLWNTDSLVGTAIEMCRLAETWQSNPAIVLIWLERIKKVPEVINEHLQLFMSALFVHNFDKNEVKQESFKLLLKIVENNNDFAATVMTLILYQLAKEKEPFIQLELLRGLTKMAVQKENVNLILHTLELLRNKHSMKTLLVDLYVRLWKVECRCYPYLQKLLMEDPIYGKEWKFDMTRALAIKEICEIRPEQHGPELVKLLSQILNQCASEQDGQSSALALQGITSLCNAEIVNIATTWRALAPRLSRDKRPVVIKSLCNFFGCVLSMQCSGQEYDKLVSEVVIKLWSYVSANKDVEVLSAALNVLSKADMGKMSLKTLPECYRQKLKLPASYAKTPVDAARKPEDVLTYIPGECWIQMLQNLEPSALDAAGDMLAEWLSVELTFFRSGINRTAGARGEPPNYSCLHHHSICRAIIDYLQRSSQITPEPSKIPVARQCLRILSHNFPRTLPPLNWTFLQEFLQEPELRYYSLTIATVQASTSESARRVIEKYLNTFDPSTENEKIISHLFNHLGDLCKGVPPNSLKPFIEKSLNLALEVSLAYEGDEEKALLKDLLFQIKATLKRDDIHDANRTMLSLLVEGFQEKLDANSKYFDAYVDCVTELTSKYLERMTSPSSFWEVTPDKLRRALRIRSAVACKADTEVPLVWLNDCIDAALDLVGEQTSVLQNIASVMTCVQQHETNSRWLMELLGQIENAVKKKTESDNQQALVFLCDVFLLTVIILSGCDCFVPTLDSITSSRENRLLLFPQALLTLLAKEQWKAVALQVMEWLYHVQNLGVISPLYADAFRCGLMALRHDRYFKISSVWMRFVSCKRMKLQ